VGDPGRAAQLLDEIMVDEDYAKPRLLLAKTTALRAVDTPHQIVGNSFSGR
jgi:hypothetical protein